MIVILSESARSADCERLAASTSAASRITSAQRCKRVSVELRGMELPAEHNNVARTW